MRMKIFISLFCIFTVLSAASCKWQGPALHIERKAGEVSESVSESKAKTSGPQVIGEAPGGGKIVTGEQAMKDDGKPETIEEAEPAKDKTGAVAVKYEY